MNASTTASSAAYAGVTAQAAARDTTAQVQFRSWRVADSNIWRIFGAVTTLLWIFPTSHLSGEASGGEEKFPVAFRQSSYRAPPLRLRRMPWKALRARVARNKLLPRMGNFTVIA